MVNQEHLGDRLERLMLKKGVSPAQLAEAEDVTVQAVYKWLNTGQIARKRLAGIASKPPMETSNEVRRYPGAVH
jgi:predicted transcriptional regulator